MAETQTPTKKPLLSINTLVEREFIRIDGEAYELHSYETMPRYAIAVCAQLGKEIQPLLHRYQDGELRDGEDQKRFEDLLGSFCRTVVLAPSDVLAKLQIPHRLNIVLAFMALSLPGLRDARAESAGGANRSTTSKRRRASRGSTAARRARG
jgi:hypothetical protein